MTPRSGSKREGIARYYSRAVYRTAAKRVRPEYRIADRDRDTEFLRSAQLRLERGGDGGVVGSGDSGWVRQRGGAQRPVPVTARSR